MALPPTFEMERLKADAARLKAASTWGSIKGCAATAELFMLTMRAIARRDTNRYVAGWQHAMNGAMASVGLPGTEQPLAIKPAGRHGEYVKKLKKERYRLEKRMEECRGMLLNWYAAKNRRPDSFSRGLETEIRKKTRWVQRLDEELKKAEGSSSILFFDKGRSGRNFSTVRVPVYGGEGSIRRVNGSFQVKLHNKEAHCLVLEHNYHYVQTCNGVARNGLLKVAAAHGSAIKAAPLHAKVAAA